MSESENKHFESTDSRVYVSNGTYLQEYFNSRKGTQGMIILMYSIVQSWPLPFKFS